jgi:hypothetical protein
MATRLVVGAAVLALVGVPGASALGAYEDPSGDKVDKEDMVGPDITTVELDHTPTVVGFRVTVANYPGLPPKSRLAILFDLDRDITTGDQGFEHAVKYDVDASGGASVTFERFEPSEFSLVAVPESETTGSFSSGQFTAIVPRAELGNVTDFEFGLYAVRFGETERDVAGDVAPNTNLWYYSMAPVVLRLAASSLQLVPRPPRAGRPLAVSSVVRRLDTGMTVTSGAVACTARLGGVRLRVRGDFRSRAARCTMTIPPGAKGKRLAGSLTVRAHGAVVSKRFSVLVR